jgi:hypothetical protein
MRFVLPTAPQHDAFIRIVQDTILVLRTTWPS